MEEKSIQAPFESLCRETRILGDTCRDFRSAVKSAF